MEGGELRGVYSRRISRPPFFFFMAHSERSDELASLQVHAHCVEVGGGSTHVRFMRGHASHRAGLHTASAKS